MIDGWYAQGPFLRSVEKLGREWIVVLRKHGLPVLEYIRHALDGHAFLPQPSKST